MLKSYFKLAFKVLGRRKFYTFISLFGISFTLTVLMLLTAFVDNELGSHAPMSQKDRMVLLPRAALKLMMPDTTYTVDSMLTNGVMQYDSTAQYDERQRSMSRSSKSYWLIENHLQNVPGVQLRGSYLPGVNFTVFRNNKKFDLGGYATDADYWQIFDFDFVEGRALSADEIRNSTQVAVITDEAARNYFGKKSGVIGEKITLDRKDYEVVGVVRKPPTNHNYVGGDVYFPYTVLPPFALGNSAELLGGFETVFLTETPAGRPKVVDELKKIADNFQLPNPERYNRMILDGVTFTEDYARNLLSENDTQKAMRTAWGIFGTMLLLFILLPVLNLISVNVSRMQERAEEIGVRKSFGADTGDLMRQFIFENVILTFIGGLIGILLAFLLLYLINDSGWLNGIILRFNLRVFAYSFLIILLFGVLSGIVPAYKMSKMKIAEALR